MKTFAWTNYHYMKPAWPQRCQSVKFDSCARALLVTRDAVVCQMAFPTHAVGSISSAYHHIHSNNSAGLLVSLLPYRRALISVDQENQTMLLALRVKRQVRSDIADRAYVLDTFDGLRSYISYALGEIVDPRTLSTEPSFKPVVIRSYKAKRDFFQFGVNDALAMCDRETAHGS